MANDIVEEIYLNGGLDSDSDEKFIRQGDYVDALNIISNEDASGGVVANMQGTEAKQSLNKQTVVGSCKYDKNNSLILFCSNDGATADRIYEYNPHLDTLTTIVSSTLLNFQDGVASGNSKYWVKANMIDDWLAWTDNYNPPRMINIQDVGSVTDLSTYLDLHKIPPLNPPEISYGLDDSIVYNNITDGYQFKYGYIYDDFRVSVYSSGSDYAINEAITRVDTDSSLSGRQNYINIQFDSGNANISDIQVAVREGNNGVWFRIAKLNKAVPENVYTTAGSLMSSALSDNTDYIYRFYNNEGRIAIGDDGTKAYDVIPDKCESLSFIGENRLVVGGNTEGKDLIELGVTLTPKYNSPTLFYSWSDTETSSYPSTIYELTFDWDDIGRTSTLAGDYVYFNFAGSVNHDGGTPLAYTLDSYTVFDKTYTSISDILDYLVANTETPTESGYTAGAWSILKVAAQNQLVFRYTVGAGNFSSKGVTSNESIVYNRAYDYYSSYGYINDLAFKRGYSHKLALIYRDKYGIKYPALVSKDTNVDINTIASSSSGFSNIEYTINNVAPDDAVTYRWAYAYTPKSFVQTYITDVSYFENIEGDLNIQLIALDISANNQFSPPNYTVEEGDYIKIIEEGGSATALSGTFVDDAPEFLVKELRTTINDGTSDLGGIWLIVSPSNVEGYNYDNVGTSSLFMNALIEVYKTPTYNTDTLYYEIGGGGVCVGGTTNHDDWYTGNATGRLNQGDIWVRPVTRYRRFSSSRTGILSIAAYLEDPAPYINAPNKDVGIADPNVEYPESRKKYDNTLRWSNKFFQDTKINGLSTFDFDNKKDVSDNHGKIKGLEELGDSLVIICKEKVLSSYVGATEYTDTQGNVNVVKSTTALGYIRPHAEDFGTFMKESIINTGKYIYFYDIYNKSVIRKSANGLFPLAGLIQTPQGGYDYRMRTYFKNKSEALLSSLYSSGSVSDYNFSPRVEAYLGYDSEYENIYVTFVDTVDSSNTETIIFNEPSNRWKSKFSLDVDNPIDTYLFIDQYFLAAQNGSIHKHNVSSVNRCLIYGLQYSSYIQPVSHANPNQIKIYNSLGVHSNTLWTVDPIEITANINYPNGFYSKILDSEWEKDEGVFMSDIKRNMKSRSSNATNFDRLNGEALRGNVIKMKLTNSDTTKTELFKINVNSEISK